ncbi:glycosyltransferase [bacterium]|nr:glycosyltransferase [bacterium]
MHIAMVASVHPPNDARIFAKETKTLVDAGHRVTVLTLANGDFTPGFGVEFVVLPRPKNRFKRVLSAKKIFRAAIALDADLYIIHDPEILRVGRWLRKHGKKYIFDAHEPYPDFIAEKAWVPKPFKGLVKRLVAWEEMRGAKASSGIITAMRENAERLAPAGKPTIVLHNYPRIDAVPEKIPEKENTIIYVGVVMAVRFGAEMLKMAEHLAPGAVLDGWKLQVLGPVYGDGYLERCRKAAGDLIDDKRLYFPEKFIAYDGAMKMIERAKIGLSFIVPTRKYNQCLSSKIFDYMAKGTIPITTWLDAYKGIVSEADGPVFVPHGQENRVVEIIADLIKDETAIAQRAETCMRAARKKFNWEKDAREFPEFIEKIYKGKS